MPRPLSVILKNPLILHALPRLIVVVLLLLDYAGPNPSLSQGSVPLLPLVLAATCIAWACAGLFLWRRGKSAGILVAILALGEAFTIPLYLVGNVLMSPDLLAMVVFALAPGFFHGLWLLGQRLPASRHGVGKGLEWAGLLLAPLGFYSLYATGILTNSGSHTTGSIMLIAFILCTVAFHFFLLRRLGAVLHGLRRMRPPAALIIRCLVGLVLPLSGLLLYTLVCPYQPWHLDHPAWLVLTIVNGIGLCLPPGRGRTGVIGMIIRLVCLPFLAYVGIIMLPFQPFVLLGTMVFPPAVLLVAPILALVLLFSTLRLDYRWHRRSRPLRISLFIAPLLLPCTLVFAWTLQASELRRALDWLERPDYHSSAGLPFNPDLVAMTIAPSPANGPRRFSPLGDEPGLPVLDYLQRAIVFNGGSLHPDIRTRLQQLCTGEAPNTPATSSSFPLAKLQEVRASTRYEAATGMYCSTLDLAMVNPYESQAEYRSTFRLAEGAWISNYWLDIGDEQKPAQLVERRPAELTYLAQLARRRDPGLLVQESERDYRLAVFPFAGGESRRTSLEILHLAPLTLELDGYTVELRCDDPAMPPPDQIRSAGKVAWLPREVVDTLPAAAWPQRAHIILDSSAAAEAELYSGWLHSLGQTIALPADTRYHTMDLELQTLASDTMPQVQRRERRAFFLDRAIRTLLNQDRTEERQSVFIVLSPAAHKAILGKDLAEYSTIMAGPEGLHWWNGRDLLWQDFSGSGSTREVPALVSTDLRLWNWQGSTLPLRSGADRVASLGPVNNLSAGFNDEALLTLKALQQERLRNPSLRSLLEVEINVLGKQNRVLTPTLAFIVLENAEQEAMLDRLRKEQAGKANNDFDPEPAEAAAMDSPGIGAMLVLLAGFVVFGWLRRRRTMPVQPGT